MFVSGNDVLLAAVVFGAIVAIVAIMSRRQNTTTTHVAPHPFEVECDCVWCVHYRRSYYIRHGYNDLALTCNHDHSNCSPKGHDHDQYVTQTDFEGHSHDGYVTREELDNLLRPINRNISGLRTVIVQSPLGIVLGALFGGLIGGLIGMILNVLLPDAIYRTVINAKIFFRGETITNDFSVYNPWPKWGIPLWLMVAGMIIGGLAVWIVGMIRARRQSSTQGV